MKRLGICVAGFNGAVASTLAAGVAVLRRGLAAPLGVVSEPFVKSHALAPLDALVLGGWDPRGETIFEAALRNRVIERERLQPVSKELSALRAWPLPAARAAAAAVRQLARDMDRFRLASRADAVVVLNLLPTGAHRASGLYAAAAAAAGCPFVNFTPNDCGERRLRDIPHCGRDGKTGQTWLKSVIAPALRARALRVTGWYSTNLLGNEDGRIVGDPARGRAKIEAKSKLLGEMLGYEPHHLVQIHYYPPRGDNKESWDSLDFEGFLGLPMQIKINGLYRDSVLAAPMCLDLARFIELAQRRGERGPQEWLGYFFKSPCARDPRQPPPHEAGEQYRRLMDYLERGRVRS
jgi:myo-inositol-1-phosphate synthase